MTDNRQSSTPGMTVQQVVDRTKASFAPPTQKQLQQQARARAMGGLTPLGIARFEAQVKSISDLERIPEKDVREELLQRAEVQARARTETDSQRQQRLISEIRSGKGVFKTDAEALEAVTLATSRPVTLSSARADEIYSRASTQEKKEIARLIGESITDIRFPEPKPSQVAQFRDMTPKEIAKATKERINEIKQKEKNILLTDSTRERLANEREQLQKSLIIVRNKGDISDIERIKLGRLLTKDIQDTIRRTEQKKDIALTGFGDLKKLLPTEIKKKDMTFWEAFFDYGKSIGRGSKQSSLFIENTVRTNVPGNTGKLIAQTIGDTIKLNRLVKAEKELSKADAKRTIELTQKINRIKQNLNFNERKQLYNKIEQDILKVQQEGKKTISDKDVQTFLLTSAMILGVGGLGAIAKGVGIAAKVAQTVKGGLTVYVGISGGKQVANTIKNPTPENLGRTASFLATIVGLNLLYKATGRIKVNRADIAIQKKYFGRTYNKKMPDGRTINKIIKKNNLNQAESTKLMESLARTVAKGTGKTAIVETRLKGIQTDTKWSPKGTKVEVKSQTKLFTDKMFKAVSKVPKPVKKIILRGTDLKQVVSKTNIKSVKRSSLYEVKFNKAGGIKSVKLLDSKKLSPKLADSLRELTAKGTFEKVSVSKGKAIIKDFQTENILDVKIAKTEVLRPLRKGVKVVRKPIFEKKVTTVKDKPAQSLKELKKYAKQEGVNIKIKNPEEMIGTDGQYRYNIKTGKPSEVWINKEILKNPKLYKEILNHELNHHKTLSSLSKRISIQLQEKLTPNVIKRMLSGVIKESNTAKNNIKNIKKYLKTVPKNSPEYKTAKHQLKSNKQYLEYLGKPSEFIVRLADQKSIRIDKPLFKNIVSKVQVGEKITTKKIVPKPKIEKPLAVNELLNKYYNERLKLIFNPKYQKYKRLIEQTRQAPVKDKNRLFEEAQKVRKELKGEVFNKLNELNKLEGQLKSIGAKLKDDRSMKPFTRQIEQIDTKNVPEIKQIVSSQTQTVTVDKPIIKQTTKPLPLISRTILGEPTSNVYLIPPPEYEQVKFLPTIGIKDNKYISVKFENIPNQMQRQILIARPELALKEDLKNTNIYITKPDLSLINQIKIKQDISPVIKSDIIQKQKQDIAPVQILKPVTIQKLKKPIPPRKPVPPIKITPIPPKLPSKIKKDLEEEIEKLKKKGITNIKYQYSPTIAGLGLQAKRTTGTFGGYEIRGDIIKLKPVKVDAYKRRNLKNTAFVVKHRRRKPRFRK